MSPILVEIAIGLAVPLVMIGLRMPLQGFAGDRAPYAFMFVSAALATLLAGWRSGVLAVFVGQLLTWYVVIQPSWSFALPTSEVRSGLIIATISQLLTVLIIGLYQREVDKGTREREQRVALLNEALNEIDHRTRNNYQTVLAMIDLQSRRATAAPVQQALRQVSDRIQAIANASQQLAARSSDLDTVRLDDHLCGLVQQIERGLSRDGIDVDSVPRQAALDLLDEPAQMVVQSNGIEIAAPRSELLGSIGDRLDPVGYLTKGLLNGRGRRSPRLQIDHRQDGLIVVAGTVIDFVERLIEKRHALLALARALVDLPLVEPDDKHGEQLRDGRDDEPGPNLAGRQSERPARLDDHIPSQQLTHEDGEHPAAPSGKKRGERGGNEHECVGSAVAGKALKRHPQADHHEWHGKADRNLDENRRHSVYTLRQP